MKIKFFTILALTAAIFLSACGKSDADLQKSAETAVKAKAPAATVTVKDGVAVLSGEVENDAAKAAAETAAKVEGVKSVTNNLTVKPAATPAPVADTAIKTELEDAFKKKGFNDISVEATQTEVTLRGSVPADKYTEAFQIATEIAKRKINNQLSKK
ncbi:MAG: BON domain-containing protein [Pyrinomonadaceae bacterium]|nr:BON domain-containing protein [Pyrinomonadaceae bacterium]